MSRTERFRNRLADRYSRRPVPDEAVHQEKLRITREQLLDTLRETGFTIEREWQPDRLDGTTACARRGGPGKWPLTRS